jgi:hypothetical protein
MVIVMVDNFMNEFPSPFRPDKIDISTHRPEEVSVRVSAVGSKPFVRILSIKHVAAALAVDDAFL